MRSENSSATSYSLDDYLSFISPVLVVLLYIIH